MSCGYAASSWGPVVLMRNYQIAPADLGMMLAPMVLLAGPTSAVAAGYISDMLVRRWPLDGRLRILWVAYPALSICFVASLLHLTAQSKPHGTRLEVF